MTTRPGSMYKIAGRRYLDSQAIYNLAEAHEVVPMAGGWRVLAAAGPGSVRCAVVEGRAALPGQRGGLYELSAEAGASLKGERTAWLLRGLVQASGTFEAWPGEPEPSAGCGCGKTCGCAPCQKRHGGSSP